ncbi:UDP-glucose 4-epimerase GalE [Hyphomonas johnsonii]|uniref:UDP-glucose 4-epimerase n=1 Tax=Hyphomonas johnsonii MHS-2 TaxID=1280950 RepID=A0A059FAG9_9PROT|nr:UDP-glucose 4-epimerase GalE [Hyphomonas johnsonii]KCZ87597.1 UDP-glucose 4-epimerase [Hyphomonas johnsonii MHS-2]
MKQVLVTGGAGYIGTHTCVELLARGYSPVVVDNFVNSSPVALDRVRRLTNHELPSYEADVRDTAQITDILKKHNCEAVIHFAGLKAVGDSVARPLEYYSANVIGTHSLLTAMIDAGTAQFVFSSSATVYGEPVFLPYTETHPLSPTNPYGQTKLTVELMLNDLIASGAMTDVAILRYFNPIGAHESGMIGEDPHGVPNNLMPYVAQVAVGRRPALNVFGDDYDTVDGTGVRDYLHVVDLARAHVLALNRFSRAPGPITVNLGTGHGSSVLELVRAFEQASGRDIPLNIAPRRPGDIAAFWADPSQAESLLGWRAEFDLADMCRDQWAWQSQNPHGFSAS